MLKKIIVTLIASAFALTAFAQAPKSDTTSPAPTKSEKMDKKAAKGEKKAKSKGEKKSKSKGKAKSDDAKAPKAKSDEAKK
jgi:Ni/Co efflux regulator RcnB